MSGLKNTGRRGTRNFKGLKMARGTTSFWTIFSGFRVRVFGVVIFS